jgi:hypothetical protein
MSQNKPIGFILLIIGIFLIGWTVFSSYNVIQGKKDLPSIFKSNNTQLEIEEKEFSKDLNPKEIEEQIQKNIQEQIEKVFPQENIFKLFNLIAWSIFAWIIIIAGAKVSGLGIKMLK